MIKFLTYIWFTIILTSAALAQINYPQRLTSHPAFDYDPAVSPDGRFLAFTSLRSGNEDIWLLDLDKHRFKQLTTHLAADYMPVFNSNSKLVFISLRENALGDIFELNIKTGELVKFVSGTGYIDYPSISADNRYLAYCEAGGDENLQIKIYDFKKHTTRNGPEGNSPSFSRNESKLVFTPSFNDSSANRKVGIYNFGTDSVSYFNPGVMSVFNPCFSRRGDALIFTALRQDTNSDGLVDRHDRGELARYDYINGELTNVMYSRASINMPAVSTGSEYIYYAVKDSAGYDIYRINENGPVAAGITEPLIDSLLNYSFTVDDSAIIAQSYFSVGDRNIDARPLYESARIFRKCGYLSEAENLFKRLISLPPALYSGLAEIELVKLNFDRNSKGDSIDASGILKSALLKIARNSTYPEDVGAQARLELARLAYNNGEIYRSLRMLVSLPKRYNSVPAVSSRAKLLYLEIMKDNFPGDPLELVPLYLELREKYQELPGFGNDVDSAIVAMLVESNDPEGYLRYTIKNYINRYDLIGRAQIQLAEILRNSGRAGESLRLLERLNNENSLASDLKFEVLIEMSGAALDLAKYDQALAWSDSALSLDKPDIKPVQIRDEKRRQVGLLLDIARSGQGPTSLELYRMALDLDPGNIQALYGFIEASRKSGARKEAEKFIRTNSSMNESQKLFALGLLKLTCANNKSTEDNRSCVSFDKSALKKAARYIEQALALDYNNIGAYISLGYIYILLETADTKGGFAEKAVDLGLMGLALNDEAKFPELEMALYGNTAEAYFSIGNYEKAFEYFNNRLGFSEVFRSESERKTFLYKHAESAYQSGSLSIAFDLYANLLELSAGDSRLTAEIAGKLGLICQLLDYDEMALSYFDQALPFFQAGGNLPALADIHKAASLSYLKLGKLDKARQEAEIAAELIIESGADERFKSQDRIIFSILNLDIPTFKMEPMKFGETEYPNGFTTGAEHAFLRTIEGDVAKSENDIFEMLADMKAKADILKNRGEANKLGTIYNSIGLEYLNLGYRDSAAVYFDQAFKKALEIENAIGAYNVLINLGYSLYDFPTYTIYKTDSNQTSKIREKFGDYCGDLLKLIPSEYLLARANLFNFQGMAEFNIALNEYSRNIIKPDSPGLPEFVQLTSAWLDKFFIRLSKAVEYLDSSMVIAKVLGSAEIQAAILLNKGWLQLYRGDYLTAEMYFNSAMNLADIAGSELLRIKIMIAKLAEFGGAPEEFESVILAVGNQPLGFNICGPGLNKFFANYIDSCIASGDIDKLWNVRQQQKSWQFISSKNGYLSAGLKTVKLDEHIRKLQNQASQIALLNSRIRFYSRKRAAMAVMLKKIESDMVEARGQFGILKQQLSLDFPDMKRHLFINSLFVSDLKETIANHELFLEIMPIHGQYFYWLFDNIDMYSGWVDSPQDIRFALEFFAGEHSHLYIVNSFINITYWLKLANELGLSISFLDNAEQLIELKKIYHPLIDKKLLVYSKPDSNEYLKAIEENIRFSNKCDIESLNTGLENYFRGYGSVHINLDFQYDITSPLGSKFCGNGPGFNLYRLQDMDLEIGLVYLDGVGLNGIIEDYQLNLLLETWSAAGVQTIIIAEQAAGENARLDFAKTFYNYLDSLSPGQAYVSTLNDLQQNGYDDSTPACFKLLGLPGFDYQGRRLLSEKIFFSRMLKGRQYARKQDWPAAVDQFISALDLSREIGFDDSLAIKSQIIANAREGNMFDIALRYQLEMLSVAELADNSQIVEGEKLQLEQIYIMAGQIAKAAQIRRDLIAGQNQPGQVESYEKLADLYLQDGDIQQALVSLDSAKVINYRQNDYASAARISILSGKLYLNQGRIGDAVGKLKSAIGVLADSSQSPIYAECLRYLGEAYLKAGFFYPARKAFSQAKMIYNESGYDKQARDCLRGLTGSYLATQRFDSASSILESAPAGFGVNIDDLIMRGELKAARGDYTGAMDDYKTAINSAENDKSALSRLYSGIASIYLNRKQFKQAEDNFKLALNFSGSAPRDLYNLGDFYLKTGKPVLADSLIRKALITADSSGYLKLAALCYYNLGLTGLNNSQTSIANFKMADSLAILSNNYYLRNRARYELYKLGVEGYDEEKIYQSLRLSPPENPGVKFQYGFAAGEDEIVGQLVQQSIQTGNTEMALAIAELCRRRRFAGKLYHESLGNPDYQNTLNLLDSAFYSELVLSDPKIDWHDLYTDFIYKQIPEIKDYQKWLEPNEAFVSIYKFDNLGLLAIIKPDSIFIYAEDFNRESYQSISSRLIDILQSNLKDNISRLYYSCDEVDGSADLLAKILPDYNPVYMPFLNIPERSKFEISGFEYYRDQTLNTDIKLSDYLLDQAVNMSLLGKNNHNYKLIIAGHDYFKSSDLTGTDLVIYPYIQIEKPYSIRRDMLAALLKGARLGLMPGESVSDEDKAGYLKRFCRRLYWGNTVREAFQEPFDDKSARSFIIAVF